MLVWAGAGVETAGEIGTDGGGGTGRAFRGGRIGGGPLGRAGTGRTGAGVVLWASLASAS